MKQTQGIGLRDVQNVYAGPEGMLWELIMGRQVHIGGLRSSMDLAEKAGIRPGIRGIDLCCCTGAGMRFLVRYRGVRRMTGVDATSAVVELGRKRCAEEGLADKIDFILADVCDSKLPDACADFVWGEDAWCYVIDKPRLITEAARMVKPGGTVAFTDWVEGPKGLTQQEAERYLKFMKFPNVQDIGGYVELLKRSGCKVLHAEDTGRFAPYADLYINMLTMQLTDDALRIIGYDKALMEALGAEMDSMRQLAHAGKIAQGLFVAVKE
jgi:SAM-dependent methyltransferase